MECLYFPDMIRNEKVTCQLCGSVVVRKSRTQKYCENCRKELSGLKGERKQQKMREIEQRRSSSSSQTQQRTPPQS